MSLLNFWPFEHQVTWLIAIPPDDPELQLGWLDGFERTLSSLSFAI
jgi:hypothetical protein